MFRSPLGMCLVVGLCTVLRRRRGKGAGDRSDRRKAIDFLLPNSQVWRLEEEKNKGEGQRLSAEETLL